MRVTIGTVEFDAITLKTAVVRILEIAKQRLRPAPFIVTPNVDHILRIRRSKSLRELYSQAALSLADGMPVVWAGRLGGKRVPERVTGADMFPALCAACAEEGLSVFILGGPPGTAEEAAKRLRLRNPKLIVHAYCPPFGFEKDDEENRKIIDAVNEVSPGVLFVGVGSPKQELWIGQFRDQLQAGVCMGIGAAIEFEAGTLKRAPRLMQETGTEWIYRLMLDPRRLSKRYASNLRFVAVFVEELISRFR